MPSSAASPSTLDSRAQQQQQQPYYASRRRSDDSFASDAVYTSHYTSSFAQEDLLVAKIVWLRQKARRALLEASRAAAAAAAPAPARLREPSRGRQRHRDRDYY